MTAVEIDNVAVPPFVVCVCVVEPTMDPKSESVPYSNQYCVGAPSGSTLPLKVAVEVPIAVAPVVCAVGALGAAGPGVVKLAIEPVTVP